MSYFGIEIPNAVVISAQKGRNFVVFSYQSNHCISVFTLLSNDACVVSRSLTRLIFSIGKTEMHNCITPAFPAQP